MGLIYLHFFLNSILALTVINSGANVATNIMVTDVLPAGLTYLSDNSSATSTTFTSNVWNLSGVELLPTNTISLQITATVNGAGTIVNTAQITDVDQNDSDSIPGNGN